MKRKAKSRNPTEIKVGDQVEIVRNLQVEDIMQHGGQHPYRSYKLSDGGWYFRHEFILDDQRPGGKRGKAKS